MSVTKNQRGLGFQGDVIDFFFPSLMSSLYIYMYVCLFLEWTGYMIYHWLYDFLKILIPPQMLFS